MNLIERSKQVILEHQHGNGAFVASPSFDHYRYSWLRDGTFIAYSLDCVGENQAAEHFFRWTATAIEKHRVKAESVIQRTRKGEAVPQADLLHTRYTLDGEEVSGEWGTYQLDGYGAWLWGVGEHLKKQGNQGFAGELKPTLTLIADYLLPLWRIPNFDCWEEYGDQIHPSTLAAIYGGLKNIRPWLEEGTQHAIDIELPRIEEFIFSKGTAEGRFVKSVGNHEVDASLLWLHVPYAVVGAGDSFLTKTVHEIESRLLADQGLHRYPQDVYYGGGQWILLSAWLGWHYFECKDYQKARKLLQWVEGQFTDQMFLPEQVHHHLLAPDHFSEWVEQWGQPACPLLWSHAMHLILASKVEIGTKKD